MRLGFEREGMPVSAADTRDEAAALFDGVALVVAGPAPGAGRAEPEQLIRALVVAGADRGAPPLLYVGNGVSRAEALAAGATAVLASPAFVRDVVTIGRILAGRRPGNRSVMDADLGDTYGVFYLVRALCATGATGTLLMLRGLRRGEIRFFEGEVTSAQVGGMHGQAALHQLLLWTEARIELRNEAVVRRQQIPVALDQLLSHAAQFLSDLREVAGGLSPATVYEQDPAVVASLGRGLPTEVHGVLRLFDGHRTVADVLEDSSFRVLETLRVAERAAQVGLLRRRAVTRPRAVHRAMLEIEEWLVGGSGDAERPGAIGPAVAIAVEGTGPVGAGKAGKKKKGKKVGGAQAVSKERATVEVDWAALVPRSAGLDAGLLSPVVPSSAAKGEIEAKSVEVRVSRDEGREGLETVMDAGDRDRLFQGGRGDEASVTVSEGIAEEEAAWLAAERDARGAIERGPERAQAQAQAIERERARERAQEIERERAREQERARAREREEELEIEQVRARQEKELELERAMEQARVAEQAIAQARARSLEIEERAAAEARAATKLEQEKSRARIEADARVDADARAAAAARAEAHARAEARAAVEAEARAAAEAQAGAEAQARAGARAIAAAQARAVTEARAEAEAEAKAREDEARRESHVSGEIPGSAERVARKDPDVVGPSMLIEELAETRSDANRLAGAATAAAVVAASSPAPADVARVPRAQSAGAEAAATRRDARAAEATAVSSFSDDEEAFFSAGHGVAAPHEAAESFDDLDVGYQPPTFWDRLLGRAKPLPSARRRPKK